MMLIAFISHSSFLGHHRFIPPILGRLLAAFHANGIEIPRPQRVVLARDQGGPLPQDLDPTAVSTSDVDLTGG